MNLRMSCFVQVERDMDVNKSDPILNKKRVIGYKYVYPFLSVDTGIYVEEDSFVRPLFKQCINIEHPTMLLPGLCFRVCPLQVSDVQV